MTCREFADFIADYLSGELPAESRAAFDRHLSLCTNCRKYLDGYQQTLELGKRVFEDDSVDAATAVPEELVRAILNTRRQS